VQLAELTELEPMTLVQVLGRMESDGWLERRDDPADRRARCLYLTPKGKPLVDEIWHLADLTRREALAGIPKKHADLMFELLEKIQSNFTSLEPLQPTPAGRVPGSWGCAMQRGSPLMAGGDLDTSVQSLHLNRH
jgi:DNA-binding PadR family transcriptional regulator